MNNAIVGLLILVCCAMPRVSSALPTPDELGLHEAYIEVGLGKHAHQPFYWVWMNDKELPYLEITDIVEQWLHGTFECQYEKGLCHAHFPNHSNHYQLDLNHQKLTAFSKNRPNGTSFMISKDQLIHENHRLWLRLDAWANWLPLSMSWSIALYRLHLSPHFLLKPELLLAQEASRRLALAQKHEHQQRQHQQPIEPKDPLRAELRFRVQAEQSTAHHRALKGQLGLNVDLFKGTLFSSGHIYKDPHHWHMPHPFWRYRKRPQIHYYLLDLGDTDQLQSLLFPRLDLHNGIRFNRLEPTLSTLTLDYEGFTQPNTLIDVYLNGTLHSTLQSDANGQFRLQDPSATPLDRYLLRFYFQDGHVEEKSLKLPPSPLPLLKTHQWDAYFNLGELNSHQVRPFSSLPVSTLHPHLNPGTFMRGGTRVGVIEGLSIGLSALRWPLSWGQKFGAMLDVAFHPFSSVHLGIEALWTQPGWDLASEWIFTGLPGHTLRFETRHLSLHSPLRSLTRLKNLSHLSTWPLNPPRESLKVSDTFSWKRSRVISEFEYTSEAKLVNFQYSHRITSRLSTQYHMHVLWPKDTPSYQHHRLTTYYLFNAKSRFEINGSWHHSDFELFGQYRWQGGLDNPFDLSLGLIQDIHHQVLPQGQATWRITPRLTLNTRFRKRRFWLSFRYEDILAPSPRPRTWNEFAQGTLSGTVYAPQGPAPQTPIAHATLWVDNHTTTTDSQGNFELRGLTPYKKITFRIDPNSLDPSMLPAQDTQVFVFRPGTHIRHSPTLVWTTGIDGQINLPHLRPKAAKIYARNIANGKIVAQGPIEPDGFFILEGLPAGQYCLETQGLPNPPQAKMISIPKETQWISDLRIP